MHKQDRAVTRDLDRTLQKSGSCPSSRGADPQIPSQQLQASQREWRAIARTAAAVGILALATYVWFHRREVAVPEDPAGQMMRDVAAGEAAAPASSAGLFRQPGSQPSTSVSKPSAGFSTASTVSAPVPGKTPPSASGAGGMAANTFRDRLQDGSFGPVMVIIAAGVYQMGSAEEEPERYSDEGPQHEVGIRSFALAHTEATFDDYDRFARATGRRLASDAGWGRGTHPVINVSWKDATAYVSWLGAQTGEKYRLPSEAEWEYAARARISTPFNTGQCIAPKDANFDGNDAYTGCPASLQFLRKTRAVGFFPANPFNLHDMHGNVWEWVQDCHQDSYADTPRDGSPALARGNGVCTLRVLRGGAWINNARNLRSANRGRYSDESASDIVGLRVARTL